jgi:hypothetical protein
MNARIEWELETAMRRLNMNRNVGGCKPMWKYTAACGAIKRTGKAGGIDAIQYRREVLIPKLILFAKKCGPDFIAQEDKCPLHASHFQQELVYDVHHVLRLL